MGNCAMVADSARRRRVDIAKRRAVDRGRTIRRTQHEDHRSTNLEKRINALEHRLGWITNVLLGLLSSCFAIGGAVYADGGFRWEHTIGAAIIAFLIATTTSFLFPNMTKRCFE
jgi:hypothetical protein